MANYKESAIYGTQWTRARSIRVDNEYNKTPRIFFSEENILQVPGQVISQTAAQMMKPELVEPFTDPATQFPLLDPDSDIVLGTATYGDLRTILYSMYRYLADARDLTEANAPPAAA